MRKIPYNIAGLLKDRILVLDGAMGTMIQKLKFDESLHFDIENYLR